MQWSKKYNKWKYEVAEKVNTWINVLSYIASVAMSTQHSEHTEMHTLLFANSAVFDPSMITVKTAFQDLIISAMPSGVWNA